MAEDGRLAKVHGKRLKKAKFYYIIAAVFAIIAATASIFHGNIINSVTLISILGCSVSLPIGVGQKMITQGWKL